MLHLYSGRRDPEFALTGAEASELRALLGRLTAPGHGTALPAAPALGYRGITVRLPDGGLSVYRETVEVSGELERDAGSPQLHDPAHAVETTLVTWARAHLGADLPYAWIPEPRDEEEGPG